MKTSDLILEVFRRNQAASFLLVEIDEKIKILRELIARNYTDVCELHRRAECREKHEVKP